MDIRPGADCPILAQPARALNAFKGKGKGKGKEGFHRELTAGRRAKLGEQLKEDGTSTRLRRSSRQKEDVHAEQWCDQQVRCLRR